MNIYAEGIHLTCRELIPVSSAEPIISTPPFDQVFPMLLQFQVASSSSQFVPEYSCMDSIVGEFVALIWLIQY